MGSRTVRRGLGVAAITVIVAVIAVFGLAVAGPASAATVSCPKPGAGAILNAKTATNVGASFSNSGTTTTYQFFSSNENPTGGVPGLIKYCVYPTPTTLPTSITPQAKGFNGAAWVAARGTKNFGFVRPGGNKTNIPLDGKTVQVGTATWGTVPTVQNIVLHVNDATTCARLYGGTSATCFVKPGLQLGPVCDAASADTTGDVYDAIPRDVVDCAPPSLGFEAHSVNEFGNEVTLSSSGGQLASLKVAFNSYACSDSGHWQLGQTDPCKTTANTTFNVPITANIYDPSDLTTPLATVTVTQTIPYRPSADPVKCPGGADSSQGIQAGSQWFNPAFGTCQYSIVKVLTFNFPAGTTLPSQVVWTVAFNTSTAGYSPLGTGNGCNSTDQGCPYDSLNVGVKDYPNAPFVGSDTVSGGAAIAGGIGGTNGDTCGGAVTPTLQLVSPCWAGFRPLGEIKAT